jgi:Undecaprenyl-phosphate glucose phosphotransferase
MRASMNMEIDPKREDRPSIAVMDPTAVVPPRRPLLLELAALAMRVVEIGGVIAVSLLIIAFDSSLGIETTGPSHVRATLIGALIYGGLAEIVGCYDADVRFSVRAAWGRLLTTWVATAMFMLTLSFFFQTSGDYSRGWAALWFAGGAGALCTLRGGAIAWMRALRRKGVFNHRVAIFGASPQGERLARHILGSTSLTITLMGFFDDRTDTRIAAGDTLLPVRGNLGDLIQAIRREELDQVVIALPWSAETRLQEVVAELAVTPVRIRLAPDLASFAFAHRPVVLMDSMPLLTLFERPLSGFDQLVKRWEDILLGALFLILASPVLIAAAIAIRLEDGGPIFFRQAREGFNNRHFHIWKLRTMRTEQCETDGIRQAQRGDPRITRIGAFLRRTSIDELPQLFNVLKGEMSIVGPRPHAPSTRAGERMFGEIIKTYAARHNVKPGITGWAQISGYRGETDTEDKLLKRLEFDLHYIENWSLGFDIYIIIKTAVTQIFSRQAY